MYSTIILDFVGVIADIDYKQLIKDLPLKEKFSGLRVFLNMKKNPQIKGAFRDYQKGLISLNDFERVVSEVCPKSSYIVPIIFNKIPRYAKVNEDVLGMAEVLRSKGVQVIVMSNTIPETEKIMQDCELEEFVDGVICSTQIQRKKPTPDIYKYAIEKYDIKPYATLMIDDTQKNLDVASQFGFETKRCKNSKETYEFLSKYFHNFDSNERKNYSIN